MEALPVSLPSTISVWCFWLPGNKRSMGLSNFPYPAQGMIPALVMNTVVSMVLLKNIVRTLLEVVAGATSNSGEDSSHERFEVSRARRVSITRYESLCKNRCKNVARANSTGIINSGTMGTWMECCVCLCRFEGNEEVSELSCKHFFHKGCLQKWFENQHSTCPLCRSIF